MKPKVWLVKNGHLPAGSENVRGRLSLAHKALIEEAVSKGALIDGFVKSTDATARVERVAADRVVDVPDVARDEDAWEAVGKRNDSTFFTVGMRTVCNGCHNSLTYCRCDTPRVWDGCEREVFITFRPRRANG